MLKKYRLTYNKTLWYAFHALLYHKYAFHKLMRNETELNYHNKTTLRKKFTTVIWLTILHC